MVGSDTVFDNEMKYLLVQMMEWFHQLCEENSIRYYVLGGTLLGAIRHNGFIPWDDDIDVGIPRDDYSRFIKLSRSIKGRYIIESPLDRSPDFFYTYAKVYDTETTLIEHTKSQIKRGLFLDVFPLDGVSNDLAFARKEYNRIDLTRRFLIARTTGIRKGRKLSKNLAIYVARAVPFVNNQSLIRSVDKMCQKHNFDKSSYVGNLMSPWKFKEVVPREVFGNPTRYEFESIFVYGAEKPEEYLSSVYGDWRKLPPIEKQVTHHDFVKCDLHKSYLLD